MTTLPPDRFDVIVVGAGPAGVTAAMALGKAGFSVLVCEAGIFPGAENWSGAVYFSENLEHPEAFGPEIVAAAPYERRLVERGAYLYNGHSLLGASLRSPDVFRSCYTVLRPVYDRYLAEVAREHGVMLACETTVQSLIRHRGRVIGVHTERGPAYADVVFLAEGDASHLVTQEGYEQDSPHHRSTAAPHFLQGVKEVISLPEKVLEERFGLAPGEGLAYEMLLRNASRKGRTARLNMGGFVYTNRTSLSLGFVLPLDNLRHHFEGDHNILMEWLKGLPEIARMIDGGELTSYGAKIIRGGGLREIPRLVDDGLAIGGAATGIGLDFPYPNFTGPATAMGLHFARAVRQIAADAGGLGGRNQAAESPFTERALRKTYLEAVESSHYYRSARHLRDWPAYVERTQFFFEKQLDLVNNSAYILSRPALSPWSRYWSVVRLLRRVATDRQGSIVGDCRELARAVGLGMLLGAAATPRNLLRVLWNTVGALLPSRSGASIGSSEAAGATSGGVVAGGGVAVAQASDGAQLRALYRVMAGGEEPGRAPWLFRWYWRRFGGALANAFSDVYTNDATDVADKLRASSRYLAGCLSIWDIAVVVGAGAAFVATGIKQAAAEWFEHSVLRWEPRRFGQQLTNRLLVDNHERIRLDDDRVAITTSYEAKLGTITYQAGHHSHIKVLWPTQVADRHDLSSSALWNICPAKVYEVRRNPTGQPGVVVNFENCIKCETCWRATGDVHWSRATRQRLIYQTYTPAQHELHAYLADRSDPQPRLGSRPAFVPALLEGLEEADAGAMPRSMTARAVARLERTQAALHSYRADLARSPLALEEGRRSHLRALLGAARDAFTDARRVWDNDIDEFDCAAAATLLTPVWDDAAERFAQMQQHAEAHRFFWAEVLARQLEDHHFAAILTACRPAAVLGEVDVGVSDDPCVAKQLEVLEWRRREAEPRAFDAWRNEVRAGCERWFDNQAVRALERGEPLSVEQQTWLRDQLAAARPETADYGRRDVMLEELASTDPSLALMASSHLLTVDLLALTDTPATELDTAQVVAATIHCGRRGARRLQDGGTELDVRADFVPTALAERYLVVVGGEGFLVDAADPRWAIEDVGSIGLIGARIRRLHGVRITVPEDRRIDLSAVIDPVSLEDPAAGEPYAPVLGVALRGYLATVRGSGTYLLQRAREHASGRVQFPGAFEDEAGRDTVAKFGAVKRMLAEMEVHRYVLESSALANPGGGDDWSGLAASKVLASQAFGPGEGSFSYNTGQIFGGTAFSEDDDIAKYYRDSAAFRFLLGHDDALCVQVGQRRLAAAESGGGLIPCSDAEQRWTARAAQHALLGEPARRYQAVCQRVEEWAQDLDRGANDLIAHVAGRVVIQVLAAKSLLVRSARRLDGGIPTEAMVEAARLALDRLDAETATSITAAKLAPATLAAGDELLEHGDAGAVSIPDAEPYESVYTADQSYESGEWLRKGFDPVSRRCVPEILAHDPALAGYRSQLETELRERFEAPKFDGMPYGRYLEKLHMIPDRDLDYMVRRGFMRMPIANDLGGEGALKAEYYILSMLIGRYGDAALSLAIMGNTSIGTTPALIGLYQDLPRAQAELERVREHPEVFGELRDGFDGLLAMLRRPKASALAAATADLGSLVEARVGKSMVLKYLGGGFLRAFQDALRAGQQRDLDSFGTHLRQARELIDDVWGAVDERLQEYPRRRRAHELFLKTISAGYISAFALTEPTAGSDSGGVKTTARADRRRVQRDADGVLWFWLDQENERHRRNLLDADRVEHDYSGRRLLYRFSNSAAPALINHSDYDYDKDAAERTRFYLHGDRKVHFSDIGQLRTDAAGELFYEYWVLNGAKMWITNGRFCHCMVLYARTDPEGVTGFMVDRHAEGLVVGADEEKLGQRGSPTNELSLNNVRVPHEAIIGFRGRGQVNALETLNTGRAGLAVTTHSTIAELAADAIPYLRGEVAPGFEYSPRDPARRLERYWMGRVAEELAGTASVTYEMIGLLDNKRTGSVRMESAIGKYYGTESEHDCIDWMERARGLEGQTWLHRVEKTRRDARVLNIYEGTNEVQRFLLLKDLVQRVSPDRRPDAGEPEARELAYPELVATLDGARRRLLGHVGGAVERFGQQVWANVGMQPCFFRLAEIAGLTKVVDAVLYRLEWAARRQVPAEYQERLERVSRLFVQRAASRIAALERRYEIALAYLAEGRYPPETQLGFLSLEEVGAPAEGWGLMPDDLIEPRPQPEVAGDIEIAVLLKPVPAAAPRPRLAGGGFAEPLRLTNPADETALVAALKLKKRAEQRIKVSAYTVAGAEGAEVVRRALALGADHAVHLESPAANGTGAARHDGSYVARVIAAALRRRPAELVLCGARAADTEQGVVPSYLATALGSEVYGDIASLRWGDGRASKLEIAASSWAGRELSVSMPCVVAMLPQLGEPRTRDLGAWVRAATVEIERLSAASLAGDRSAISVRHRARPPVSSAGHDRRVDSPEDAAGVLIDVAGSGGAATGAADAYGPRLLSMGEQPDDPAPSCLFVLTPTGVEFPASASTDLRLARELAGGVGVALDVVIPVDTDQLSAEVAAGFVLAATRPRRLYVVGLDGAAGFSAPGHLEWLEEFWAMYRGEPRWLLAASWANELFARFATGGIANTEAGRCWSWYNVDSISNGGDHAHVGTRIYGGAARAEAELPLEGGLRVLTLRDAVELDLDGARSSPRQEREPQVYQWSPRLVYDSSRDPLARLLASLASDPSSLRDAEIIIDFGYGAGGREGIAELAEPLRRLLVDEMGLRNVMIGATRKVTQDLELLPADRQIGQTGVAVNPKLIIALAVSGAPQHVDYIGDRAVILSFNVDPNAPLMRLNEQQPTPLVHPIVGDVWDTVPRFVEAIREHLRQARST
ncbi:MAG TPA: acyl-CoA dehydrogenase family protein [Acidobacteriota bacterium]|nr:acyl-CoA dehydrogenase family protein [Acidobacteriota bacterium]